ncbi:lysM domain receptor-like kinase 3 [Argentina anserina]|uniref:lysM domain receptor-like kinase 3 n=1 Tax=Argentina anserina TaxID=57926 RepID=UPI00217653D0|nr:lysM domain receptor-like kinase 3 [Potentilla anserina]
MRRRPQHSSNITLKTSPNKSPHHPLSMCKSKMAIDAAQPTSSPRPTTHLSSSPQTRTQTQTRPTFISSSSSPSTSTSNTSYKLYSTASTSSLTSLGSFRLSLPENPNLYDFSEIRAATNNFLAKRLLSSSSTPSWRCTLRGRDTVVFQRKFRRKLTTQELKSRLSMLCRSHHTSIIKLLGASVSGDNTHLFLVYDFVTSSASLAACLRNKANPDFTVLSTWMSRMQVAADLAQGLDYIHNNTGLNVTIVHNRIKSSSVLVTEPNCNARICHFGTAQLCGEADFTTQMDSKPKSKSAGAGEIVEEVGRTPKSKLGTQFEGERGYMSPEYQASGVATQKSDVYAFGVVILELLSGQEPFNYKFDKARGDFVSTTVVDSAQAAVAGGGLRTWVDKRLKDSFPVEIAEKLTRVALDCVQVDPDKRPGMGRVVGKISKFYLDSRTWSEKFGFPTGISISLVPR